MVITSEIVYIDEGELVEEMDYVFKEIYCRTGQDLHLAIFKNNPVFILRINGELEAYCVLELHRLKRATLWNGPIVKNKRFTELVLKELILCACKNGIRAMLIYPLDPETFNIISKLIQQRLLYKLSEAKGLLIGLKEILISEEDLIKTYNRSLKENLKRAKKNQIEIFEIINHQDYLELIELHHKMYDFKGMKTQKSALSNALLKDFEYIKKTKRGMILGARYDGLLVGGSIQFFTRNTLVLQYAASNKEINLPIIQPLNHFAIIEAIKRGVLFCDFGEITNGNDRINENDQKYWDGFTYMKNSFGIIHDQHPKTIEVTFNKNAFAFYKTLAIVKNIFLRW